jgi:hypothetical protein
MPGRVIDRNRKFAVAQVVTVLSCTAVLLSIVTRLDHQPLPGTRTAIELIGRHRNGGISKVAVIDRCAEVEALC